MTKERSLVLQQACVALVEFVDLGQRKIFAQQIGRRSVTARRNSARESRQAVARIYESHLHLRPKLCIRRGGTRPLTAAARQAARA